MTDTGYDWSEPLLRHRAAGYTRRGKEVVNAKFLDMQQPFAAGSLYSTAEDMLKWDQALYTDRVLPESARAAMFTPFKDFYAYGWVVQPRDKSQSGHQQVGHGGGINGFATMIQRVPDDKVTVIVLCNVDNISAAQCRARPDGHHLPSAVPDVPSTAARSSRGQLAGPPQAQNFGPCGLCRRESTRSF